MLRRFFYRIVIAVVDFFPLTPITFSYVKISFILVMLIHIICDYILYQGVLT